MQTLLEMQSIVPKVIVAEHVYEAAIDLARLTRPEEGKLPAELRDKVQYGAGPRASIALLLAGKARALLHKRCHVTTDDFRGGSDRAAASDHTDVQCRSGRARHRRNRQNLGGAPPGCAALTLRQGPDEKATFDTALRPRASFIGFAGLGAARRRIGRTGRKSLAMWIMQSARRRPITTSSHRLL